MKKPSRKQISKEELLKWLKEVRTILILGDIWSKRSGEIYQQIRQLIGNQPSKEKVFVRHIENHLKDMKIKGKVICKICGKNIDEIYQEARVKMKELKE
ncbi:MAG: hypothetical protein ACTSPV_00495 [Candidatus Hodarchaeales archaeon]